MSGVLLASTNAAPFVSLVFGPEDAARLVRMGPEG